MDSQSDYGMIGAEQEAEMTRGNEGSAGIRERMQELYVYDLYGFRPEIKALAGVLYPLEIINCFATGIYQGKRRLLVVTHYRIILVCTRFGSPAEIITIRRESLVSHAFHKRFFTSSLEFDTKDSHFELQMVSRRVLEMFSWAIEQPLPK
jgi:hypothetical protein